MIIDLITIFPDMFAGPFSESMLKRAVLKGLVKINLVNLRDYAAGPHLQVDDAPYGGGSGMVLKPEPLFRAVEDLSAKSASCDRQVILLSPRGRLYNQQVAQSLSEKEHLIIICGHYEGVDERVRLNLADDEISLGDFILTGGELAAACVVDSVVRLLPGLLSEEALFEESFTGFLLEYPHYTRPAVFRKMAVPRVLLSGNHQLIARWRREESLKRTYDQRPELLKKASLSADDCLYLDQLKKGD